MLTVEDGSGIADAESYLSAADFKSLADRYGVDYSDYGDSEIEAGLRRGTAYLDGHYRDKFKGVRTHGRDQALEWPRSVRIAGGRINIGFDPYYGVPAYVRPPSIVSDIADTEIPRELKQALVEATKRELDTPGSLTSDTSPAIHSVQAGSVRVDYEQGVSQSTSFTLIDSLLSGLLRNTKLLLRA